MRTCLAKMAALLFCASTAAMAADPPAVDMYLSPQCPSPADSIRVAFHGTYGFPNPRPLSLERNGDSFKVVAEATGSYFPELMGTVYLDLPALPVGQYRVNLHLRMQTASDTLGPETFNGSHSFEVVEVPPVCDAERVVVEGDSFLTTPVGQKLPQGLRVRVDDGHGHPIAGVPLALHQLSNPNLAYPFQGGFLAYATTDESGRASFDAPSADLAGAFQYLVNIQRVNPLLEYAYFIVHNAPVGSGRPTYPIVSYQPTWMTRKQQYFMTGNPEEMAKLDQGWEWFRSGAVFLAFPPEAQQVGAIPVCRFYGLPSAGLDSHFFSASSEECAEVAQRFAGSWLQETSNAFKVYLPSERGVCPPGTTPLYRAFNNQAAANHWYGAIPSNISGWTFEGYGGPGIPVAMCTPV